MKLRSLLLAAFFAAAPATAFAGPLWIGPTAGLGVPFGDFSDVASTGFNLGLIGDYEINRNLAWGGEIGWQTYGGSDDFEKELSAAEGSSVDVRVTGIPVLVHGKLMIPSGERSVPYAKLALGFYNTKVETESSGGTSDESNTDFAYGIGGGLNIGSGSRIKYGLEGMLHFVSTEGESTNILLVRAQMMFGAGGN